MGIFLILSLIKLFLLQNILIFYNFFILICLKLVEFYLIILHRNIRVWKSINMDYFAKHSFVFTLRVFLVIIHSILILKKNCDCSSFFLLGSLYYLQDFSISNNSFKLGLLDLLEWLLMMFSDFIYSWKIRLGLLRKSKNNRIIFGLSISLIRQIYLLLRILFKLWFHQKLIIQAWYEDSSWALISLLSLNISNLNYLPVWNSNLWIVILSLISKFP